jgi:phosphoenolpyruvate---glycerone phosphotransferase subunit DhaL
MNVDTVKKLFANLAVTFEQEKENLGQLDAVLGDGDHGVGMARGFNKANEAVAANQARDDVGNLFQSAGRAFMSATGGASGSLFAMIFLELGKASLNQQALDASSLKSGITNAVVTIKRLGKSDVGDKTFLDALIPVQNVLEQSQNETLLSALEKAVTAAKEGASQTTHMPAKRGRAQYVPNAGVGHPDPGATSVVLIFESWLETLKGLA